MADPTVPLRQPSRPQSPNGSGQTRSYCGACGNLLTRAFCQHCGAPTTAGEHRTDEAPAEVSEPLRPSAGGRFSRSLLILAAVVVAILLVGATVGIVALLGHNTKHGPSYATEAGQRLAPVLADNAVLATAVGMLTPDANPQVVRSDLATTEGATQAAQQSITTLTIPKSQAVLASQIRTAITSEIAWLQTASAVLGNTASPLVSQLSGLGVETQTKIETLGASVPAAATTAFPSSTQIVTYASAAVAKKVATARATAARSAAKSAAKARASAAAKAASAAKAETTAADTEFSSQVLGLLNQSTSAREAISSFYVQLQNVADGGTASFTLAQAEQQITTIVANRTSLATAAQALNAPNPVAQAISNELIAAFNASLADDTDLDNCLNQDNDGTEAFIFQGCLSSSTSDAATATADKQIFLSAYNQLRATIGEAPVNLEF